MRFLVESAGGDSADRKQLQDVGQLRERQNVNRFCREMLDYFGVGEDENLVVDGIRHLTVVDALSAHLFPRNLFLLHLDVDDSERRKRASIRGDDASDFTRAASHCVEGDLEYELPKRADSVIDATRSIEVVVDECVLAIETLKSKAK